MEGRFGEAAGITAGRWRDLGEGSGGDGLDGDMDDFGVDDWGHPGVSSSPRDAARRGGVGGSENRQVEQLLLQVFSCLPEPDCIYGVPSPAADLSAQATVYAHEGGWQNTLPTYDTLSQHQPQQPQQPSLSSLLLMGGSGGGSFLGGNGVGESMSGVGLQTGIATSLQVWQRSQAGDIFAFSVAIVMIMQILHLNYATHAALCKVQRRTSHVQVVGWIMMTP